MTLAENKMTRADDSMFLVKDTLISEETKAVKRVRSFTMRPVLTRTKSEIRHHIDQAENIGDILTLADNEDVPLDGCNSAEEMKVKIFQTIDHRRRKLQTSTLWDRQRQQRLRGENEHKREELAKLFASVSKSLAPSIQNLNNIFKQEGSDTDLSLDFLRRTRDLTEGDCNVLITGQTNGGKSTFLNLLLGVDVLPKSILSCTSSICKLKYCSTYKVVVVHEDGHKEERTFEDHKDTKRFLQETVATKQQERREHGTTFKEVHVLLPAALLENGITIIDSPGFGENEAMDSVVSDFVSENNVSAFIYILKTDSSGGVQEDRLIRFLRSVLNMKDDQLDESHYFDPKSALFVCNRWDLIEDEFKPKVRDHALNKLRSVWPGLEDKQVCFFSSIGSYESEEWDILLQSLDDLFQLARQVDISSSYCWLKYIVKECTFFMKTIVYQMNQTELKLQQRLQNATKKLSSLETDCKSLVDGMSLELLADCGAFRSQLQMYMRSNHIKRELSQWEVEDIPEYYTFQDHVITKEEMDEFIVERIVSVLDSAEIVKTFINEFVDKMQRDVSKLGTEMDMVQNELRDSSKSLRSSSSSFDSFSEAALSVVFSSSMHRTFADRLKAFAEADNSKEVAVVGLSRTVVKATLDVMAKVKGLLSRKKSSECKDPKVHMTRKAQKICETMSKDDEILSKLVSRYSTRIQRVIDNISLCVPRFIRTIDHLIQEIIAVSSETQTAKTDLQVSMEHLEEQKELVRGYGYLHVKEFTPDDVVMQIHDPRVTASTKVTVEINDLGRPEENTTRASQVLWARFSKGTIFLDDFQELITVKYYSINLPDCQLYKEIAKLRCLSSSSVSNFIGMTRFKSEAAFIFLDELITAKTFLRGLAFGLQKPNELCLAVPRLLEQLVEGLETIHKAGLVHMELTAESITMNTSGDVKLSMMCVPRQATLPVDMVSVTASDFTCLSPEVLRGEIYTKEDDIYSLGLIVAEVLQEDIPFAEQKNWTLAEFIDLVDPPTMLIIPQGAILRPLSDFLRDCAAPRAQRPYLHEVTVRLLQECRTKSIFETCCNKKTFISKRKSSIWFIQ